MEDIQKVSELFNENYIITLNAKNKKEALNELINIISKNDKITDKKRFEKEIFKREKLMSTGIGLEVAVPHVRHKSIKDFVIALGIQKDGIEYESIDSKPVKLIFMIGASDTQDKEYIKLLSRLVLRLKNKDFINNVLNASTPNEVYQIIKDTK
ncbi:MAG: PTS sugar transporter subunit IIA [Candidatus Cloacimonetes bacterium]|nr:PTS sugar transporter subunit IIA [Candidatus Cloacimonadota bacterium]